MLCVDDLIAHMNSKNIKFEIFSITDATPYLESNSNYFKLTSYRKNYSKYVDGPNTGKYENLDFAFLVELSRIDVELRHVLLNMCLDIEHFLKVALVKDVEKNMKNNTGEDGYRIVSDFIAYSEDNALDADNSPKVKKTFSFSKKIEQSRKNPYCKDLVEKHKDNMPIWVFLEILSFGEFESLIGFYQRTNQLSLKIDIKSLDRVRQIRNAAAHNNCVINDLTSSESCIRSPRFITDFLAKAGVNENARDKKLSNKRINQIVHLFYIYNSVVPKSVTRTKRLLELDTLVNSRMIKHKEFFESNSVLTSTYNFFLTIVSYLVHQDTTLKQ